MTKQGKIANELATSLWENMKESAMITKKGLLGFLVIGILYLLENVIFIGLIIYGFFLISPSKEMFTSVGDSVLSGNDADRTLELIGLFGDNKIFAILLLIVVLVLVISAFAMQYYVSKTIYIKKLSEKSKNINILNIFFVDNWKFFWRGTKVISHVLWYVFYPLLAGVITIFLLAKSAELLSLQDSLPFEISIGAIVIALILFTFYRLFLSFPAWFYFIYDEKVDAFKIKDLSVNFMKNRKLSGLLLLVVIFVITAISNITWFPDVIDAENYFELSDVIINALHILIILLVVEPFITAMSYLFLSKNNKK